MQILQACRGYPFIGETRTLGCSSRTANGAIRITSRAVEAQGNLPAWQVGDGWRADVWQKLDYRPFTDPCFGDTVAAGVLSTFIYQAKRKLANLPDPELPRLMRILDELDLYRPSSDAKVEYTGQDSVLDKPNFSYINFGTWRDQIVDKENGGYRRRGVGRALFVKHLQKEHGKSKRYRYFVQDGIQWSDRMDQW